MLNYDLEIEPKEKEVQFTIATKKYLATHLTKEVIICN
jgi:hypothetical protein